MKVALAQNGRWVGGAKQSWERMMRGREGVRATWESDRLKSALSILRRALCPLQMHLTVHLYLVLFLSISLFIFTHYFLLLCSPTSSFYFYFSFSPYFFLFLSSFPLISFFHLSFTFPPSFFVFTVTTRMRIAFTQAPHLYSLESQKYREIFRETREIENFWRSKYREF